MTSLKRFSMFAILMACLAVTNALASDDAEKATEISLTSNPAAIERTAETESKLKVTLPVVFQTQVCTQTAVRRVVGRHPSCGFTTVPVFRCYGNPYPGYGGGMVCRNGICYPGYPRYPGYPGGPYFPGDGCGYYPEQVMNSCEHDETYCAQYGTVSTTKPATVVIKFKKNTALTGNQTESFELTAAQASVDSKDVNFLLKGVNTQADYVIKAGNGFLGLGRDRITVKKKRN